MITVHSVSGTPQALVRGPRQRPRYGAGQSAPVDRDGGPHGPLGKNRMAELPSSSPIDVPAVSEKMGPAMDVPPPSHDGIASLQLGADPAATITFWVGIPAWTLVAILFSLVLPGLACVFAFVWVLTCWYSWMGKFRSAVQVDLDHIRVVTPVRHFVASWNAIKAVHPRSHISLVSFDGAKFRIPQYSATLVTEAAAERAPLFLGRKRLELAITSAMNGAGAAHITTRSLRSAGSIHQQKYGFQHYSWVRWLR